MRSLGFTLVEAMVTLAVTAILLGLATASLHPLLLNNRLTTAHNSLVAAFSYARSEAIKRGRSVVVCKSADGRRCYSGGGWEQGWLGFVDHDGDRRCTDANSDGTCDDDLGPVLLTHPRIPQLTISATGNPARRVVFTAQGFAPGYAGTFSLCSTTGSSEGGFVLSLIGRIRSAGARDTVACER